MASNKKDYFGLTWIVSLILAIIPFTAWLLGAITRFKEGHWICGLIRVIGLGFILWVIDLVLMILRQRILRIA